MKSPLNCRRHQSGLSYIEVLIAVALIAATVIPVTDALRGAMDTADADAVATANHYRLAGKLEEVVANPFSALSLQAAGPTISTSYSDSAGITDRRLVFISEYDGDNADADDDPFTGVDTGLLWIRVEIEGSVSAIESLVAQ